MKNKIDYTAIVTFYIIAVALRYVVIKTALFHGVSNEAIKILFAGGGPAVGAVVVSLIFKIKPVLTLAGNYKNVLKPILLYWISPVALIFIAEYAIKGTMMSLQAVPVILTYGLLEEIGWRGFLQKELKPLPQFLNVFIVAILWFIWHLNFDLTGSNLMFFGILILGSWGIGKVADSTKSLLAVSAFHSLNNFFPELNTINTMIIVLLLAVWVISLVIRKRK